MLHPKQSTNQSKKLPFGELQDPIEEAKKQADNCGIAIVVFQRGEKPKVAMLSDAGISWDANEHNGYKKFTARGIIKC